MENSELFASLKLPSFAPIQEINERKKCLKCGRKRMYFCYVSSIFNLKQFLITKDCRIYVNDDVQKFAPKVKVFFFIWFSPQTH